MLGRAAAVATILGLIITILVILQPHTRKVLQVRYVAKVSLVRPEARVTSRVKVMFDSLVVLSPTKLFLRVTNAGDVPIEQRDIEQPLTFRFDKGKVLSAILSSRSPANLEAELQMTDNGIVLRHGLLNPGDGVAIEALLDGDPPWPAAICRISGIARPKILLPDDKVKQVRVAFFGMPRIAEIIVVGLCSIVALLLWIIVVVAVRETWTALATDEGTTRARIASEVDWPAVASELLNRLSVEDRRLLQVRVGQDPEAAFGHQVHVSAWENPPVNREDPLQEALSTLRGWAPEAVADAIWRKVPSGQDEFARRVVMKLSMVPGESFRDFVSRAIDTAIPSSPGWSLRTRWHRFDKQAVGFGATAFILGIPTSLVVAAAWKAILLG